MSNLIKQVQSMFELELYSNVARVCDFALSAADQKPESLSPLHKFQLILLYADSLLDTQNYFQAENLYRQALQICKNRLKAKTANNKPENQPELNDVEIRYKIHKCCLALKQVNAAIEMLQSIPVRSRTPKINMALATLFRDGGIERSAITCYKEVLRECPLAIEAVDNLLKLGVKGVEVNSLMVEVTSEITWLNLWLKAQAQLYSRDFANAVLTYKSMDSHGLLKDNTSLLVNMGYCYHYMCEDDSAVSILQRAMRLDQNLVFGRDLLSTLLANSATSEHIEYLENLIPPCDMSLWNTEDWVVLGNCMFATKKYEKAVYFAQQALCSSNCKNIEALLLKAKCLLELGKYQDAAHHCTEAIQVCSFRYDLHQCLVDCYVKMNRLREAEAMATNACKQLNYSPQSLTLHASVLLKDPLTHGKTIRKVLEKAVSQDKTFSTNAVCMLVEFLEQEQQYEQARELLVKHIRQNPSSRLHQLLGDIYVNLQKDDDAFHHYSLALRLDPNNQRASEGLNNIGRNLSLSKRDSYYTCVGETSYASPGNSACEDDVFVQNDTDSWPANNTF